jgi:hypothetical protein
VANLANAVLVAQNDADLAWRETLLRQFADLVSDVFTLTAEDIETCSKRAVGRKRLTVSFNHDGGVRR